MRCHHLPSEQEAEAVDLRFLLLVEATDVLFCRPNEKLPMSAGLALEAMVVLPRHLHALQTNFFSSLFFGCLRSTPRYGFISRYCSAWTSRLRFGCRIVQLWHRGYLLIGLTLSTKPATSTSLIECFMVMSALDSNRIDAVRFPSRAGW
ncbi:hypothetical protein KC322_g54 [Hortaea werneckii]|nr:hypothetical protein KC322_g54 [Hortaea werneckii]